MLFFGLCHEEMSCPEKRNMYPSSKFMSFSELPWLMNKLRAGKLKNVGNCRFHTPETGFHSFKKGC